MCAVRLGYAQQLNRWIMSVRQMTCIHIYVQRYECG